MSVNVDDLVLDELSAAPGTKASGYVTLDESPGGVVIRVPVTLINGAHDGPTLVVVSGIHGDDLNSIPMVWQVAKTLDPAQLRGQVIAVPICNPPAFEAGSHRTPADDASPTCPGDPYGTVSQRIGHGLHEKFVLRADYLIDLHGGSVNCTLAPLAGVDESVDEDVRERAMQMVDAFGPDVIVDMTPQPGATSVGMFQMAGRLGAPSLYFGTGRVGFNDDDTRRGTRGVMNVLKQVGMLDGEIERIAQPTRTYLDVYHHSPWGGGFVPEVEAGDRVAEGGTLGTVYDAFGEPLGEITSEVSGIVVAIRFYPVVGAGGWVASVGSDDESTRPR